MILCPECGGLCKRRTVKTRNCQRHEFECAWCGYKDFDFSHIQTTLAGSEFKPVQVYDENNADERIGREYWRDITSREKREAQKRTQVHNS